MRLSDLQLIVNCHCEKATQLASESLERELTRSERWALGLHTFICKSCRRAVRQLREIHSAIKQVPEALKQAAFDDACQLSPSAKAKIADALKRSK